MTYGVIGNVWEWCRAVGKVRYDVAVSVGDGLRTGVGLHSHVMRGGSLAFRASYARSAYRGDFSLAGRTDNIGVRPARAIAR